MHFLINTKKVRPSKHGIGDCVGSQDMNHPTYLISCIVYVLKIGISFLLCQCFRVCKNMIIHVLQSRYRILSFRNKKSLINWWTSKSRKDTRPHQKNQWIGNSKNSIADAKTHSLHASGNHYELEICRISAGMTGNGYDMTQQ